MVFSSDKLAASCYLPPYLLAFFRVLLSTNGPSPTCLKTILLLSRSTLNSWVVVEFGSGRALVGKCNPHDPEAFLIKL